MYSNTNFSTIGMLVKIKCTLIDTKYLNIIICTKITHTKYIFLNVYKFCAYVKNINLYNLNEIIVW